MSDDHDLIITAIENKDQELAEKYAERHAKDVCDRFVRHLARRNIDDFDVRDGATKLNQV